jgi:rhomboid family GlyGly-CTERM serine protease
MLGSPVAPPLPAAAWEPRAEAERLPLGPLFGSVLPLAALALVCGLLPGVERWQLDLALAASEPWRLITGHLVHWSPQHLAWDLAVFVGLGLACERHGRGRTALTLALAVAAISFGVPLLSPGLTVYRGLSGLDAALFALLAARRLRSSAPRTRLAGGVALVALFAKLAWEVATGVPLFVHGLGVAGVGLLPEAHLLGGAAGLAVGLLSRRRARR